MSVSPNDVLPVVQALYPDPPWLAPALVAVAQVEAGTPDGRINPFARGDDGESWGAWQVHAPAWPDIARRVQATYTMPGELDAIGAQAFLVRPIVDDALREVNAVPTWGDAERAHAFQAVWQLGAVRFREVLRVAGPGASWLIPGGVVAAIAQLYGQRFGEIAGSRAERWYRYFRALGGSVRDLYVFGGQALGLLVVIGLALALGTERGRRASAWAGKQGARIGASVAARRVL